MAETLQSYMEGWLRNRERKYFFKGVAVGAAVTAIVVVVAVMVTGDIQLFD